MACEKAADGAAAKLHVGSLSRTVRCCLLVAALFAGPGTGQRIGATPNGSLVLRPPQGQAVVVDGPLLLQGPESGDVAARLAALEQRVRDLEARVAYTDTLGPNLIRNGLLTSRDQQERPTGSRVTMRDNGGCQVSPALSQGIAHPFVACFIGPYAAEPPTPTASSCDDATQASPYFFGVFDGGPRSAGWLNFERDFYMLRLQGITPQLFDITIFPPGPALQPHPSVNFYEANCYGPVYHFPVVDTPVSVGGYVRFRAWLKVLTGGGVVIGQHGNCFSDGVSCGVFVNRTVTSAARDGWYFVDTLVYVGRHFNLQEMLRFRPVGSNADFSGPFHVLLALPHASLVATPGAWLDGT